MARTPQDNERMTAFITRARCVPRLKRRIDETAVELGISSGDLVRGCMEYMLKENYDSRLIERIIESAAHQSRCAKCDRLMEFPGSRPGSEMDREDGDE